MDLASNYKQLPEPFTRIGKPARFVLLFLFLSVICTLTPAAPDASAALAQGVASREILMRDVLVLPAVGRSGRSAVHTDTVEAQIVTGRWRLPAVDQSIEGPDGLTETWKQVTADTNGVLSGSLRRGGYVDWPVVSPAQAVMLLEAAGHNLFYINGDIRAGDPYSTGYVQIPVLLQPGTNEFLFQCSRGQLRAKLTSPGSSLVIATGDRTLPDLVQGETEPVWCGVVLLNSTTNFQEASVRALTRGSPERRVSLPPLGTRKVPFLLHPPRLPQSNDCRVSIEVMLPSSSRKEVFRTELSLRVRRADQTCKRTFLSAIDDSVQYYAVNPVTEAPRGFSGQALFLSLHGAGVEAIGQAEAYSAKKWGTIVCPTNRRPYGFDWEDWGRWDALEVLGLAQARYRPDPSRIYLTGHSMGGHGTWQLGALFPDRFAAIGPSAGWISFTTYAGRNTATQTNALAQMLRRAAAASDTLLMSTNYLQQGVYILHGSADDNVPVSEARQMREVLGGFHRDFVYHEQPGVGHWWDVSDEPGADCVDWAPMFDFFAHHVVPSDAGLRRVQFVTVNPAVSARSHWVTILAQQHSLMPSALDLRCDPGKRRIVGSTTNVARLWLSLPSFLPGAALTLELDGQKIEKISWPDRRAWSAEPGLLVTQHDKRWELANSLTPSHKNPGRSGPFRQAFNNHVRFVYATGGTPQENEWALAKARYDAETFWYRGNGSVNLVADTEYLKEISSAGRRPRHAQPGSSQSQGNVVLYGNADCNGAWTTLLASSPVQVHRGVIKLGPHKFSGEDLACLFLRPNPQDDHALVGVVCGSGLPGLKLTERMPYFLSGAGFPDCLVVGAEMLTKGVAGVRAAGFFGLDWQVSTGDFAWQAP